MTAWKNIPIRRKLTGVILLTSTVSLLLACGAFILYEWTNFRAGMIDELSSQAAMIGATSTAALTFKDRRSAEDTLLALSSVRSVRAAVIFTPEGETFASYRRSPTGGEAELPFEEQGQRFEGGRLLLWRPITLDGQRIGTIGLNSDLDAMTTRLWTYVGIATLILLTAMGAAVLSASVLQSVISGPILRLAETARRVRTENNFSIREKRSGDDEVGLLIKQFNYMLEQIEDRDDALRRAHADLEERVRRRTIELTAEIARHEVTHQELVAASQAKSAFLASVTHELRTPLTSIIWSSEMLEEEFEDEGLRRYIPDLHKIARAGRNLLAIVTDILDLSKLEAGRMELHSAPFELSAVIQEVVQTAEPLAVKNGNQMDVDYSGSTGVILDNDEQKFRQSLLNLVSNACKFTRNGRVSVSVSQTEDAGTNLVAISVSDTGIGISAERMSSLFQPFSQLDSSESRKFAGTGLGLVVSQRFCNLMGGRITVESEPDKGSTFTIMIPPSSQQDTEDIES